MKLFVLIEVKHDWHIFHKVIAASTVEKDLIAKASKLKIYGAFRDIFYYPENDNIELILKRKEVPHFLIRSYEDEANS